MALWQFKCLRSGGFDNVKVCYRSRTPIETFPVAALNDLTRVYDDTVATDAKCIESLENYKYFDYTTNTYKLAFEKVAG